jgi:hypothetical protein
VKKVTFTLFANHFRNSGEMIKKGKTMNNTNSYDQSFTVLVPNPLHLKYSSVGGYLQLIIVIFGLSVLRLAGSTISHIAFYISNQANIVSGSGVSLVYSYGLSVLRISLLILFLAALLKKQKHFVAFYCSLLLIRIISFISGLVRTGGYMLQTDENLSQLLPTLGISLIVEVITIVVGLATLYYLLTSVRVRTYMGTDEYLPKWLPSRWFKSPQPIDPFIADDPAVAGYHPASE